MTILTAIGEELHSNKILEVGYDLAVTYDDQLVVLHVIPEEKFNDHKAAIEGAPASDSFTISREEQSAAEVARQAVHKSLDEYESDRIEAQGRVGNPSEKILSEVEYRGPQYLVIGTRERSPVGKAIFGSTAQRVSLNVSCPTILVRKQQNE
ncbi:universal stress protein [Haloquadratum walsbyi]|jgi:Universal stress protein UspA and related nucleotide-binding proteins|uniref:Universal stress protein UspA related nucleotide-binding protein n=1 Tax=Haloquadratum walsbyi J07HQW2 TaxID=1238425 RepID=U1MVE8_9EURY|nr:universal stress protein [Haloquadratum walsbyi]ERG94354.1 MAG: universal stress protein UspA related nucleotide-binding protein [Haloquadratum walsbyi J07HQW2]